MKHLFTLTLLVFSSAVLHGQFYHLEKGEILLKECSNDENLEIYTYANYEIYQTEDNTASGPRLANCITVDPGNEDVDLASVDKSYALFVKYLPPEPIELPADMLYHINNIAAGTNSNTVEHFELDCDDGFCSGASMTWLHGDESLDSSYQTLALYPFTTTNQCLINTECTATEKTNSNQLVDFIIKVTFSADNDGTLFSFSQPDISTAYQTTILPHELSFSESFWDGNTYKLQIGDLLNSWPEHSYLVKHYEDGIPSSTNVSISELIPPIESGEPKPISLDVGYGTLRYQSNTQLRGSLVEGSDSLRHPLTIIDDFGNICWNSIELIIEDEVELRVGSGVYFDNMTGCLQVRNKGNLTFRGNRVHQFGSSGLGNLYLRTGADVNIEQGGHLYFDGHLILSQYAAGGQSSDSISIHINSGTAMTFTRDVTIDSKDGSKLYLMMNGGQVDLSDMSTDQKQHIVLVHPNETIHDNASVINLYPNPTSGLTYIQSIDGVGIQEIELHHISGKQIKLDKDHLTQLDMSLYPIGTYVVNIQLVDGNKEYKLLRVE